jgi:hypothetical protein
MNLLEDSLYFLCSKQALVRLRLQRFVAGVGYIRPICCRSAVEVSLVFFGVPCRTRSPGYGPARSCMFASFQPRPLICTVLCTLS